MKRIMNSMVTPSINDSLISQNTSHFLNLHCDDAWNYFIYSSIFNYLNKKNNKKILI